MHYVEHLSRDKKLEPLITAHGPLRLVRRNNVFFLLCSSIMSQQLATPVARTIKQRFLDLYGGREPGPERVLATPHDRLRGIGLSNAKAEYIRNVARFALENGMEPRTLSRMADEEVIEYLTAIKGVGRWTVEMLLMFTLGREDVFAIGDGGLRSAVRSLYRLRTTDPRALDRRLAVISAHWSPYRTYASMHLWRYKDMAMQAAGQQGRRKVS